MRWRERERGGGEREGYRKRERGVIGSIDNIANTAYKIV